MLGLAYDPNLIVCEFTIDQAPIVTTLASFVDTDRGALLQCEVPAVPVGVTANVALRWEGSTPATIPYTGRLGGNTVVGELATGLVEELPAFSCLWLHEQNPALPSGMYWLNPSKAQRYTGGNVASYQTYCDMGDTRHGAGWTLVGQGIGGQGAEWATSDDLNLDYAASVDVIDDPESAGTFKFGDDRINSLKYGVFRLSGVPGALVNGIRQTPKYFDDENSYFWRCTPYYHMEHSSRTGVNKKCNLSYKDAACTLVENEGKAISQHTQHAGVSDWGPNAGCSGTVGTLYSNLANGAPFWYMRANHNSCAGRYCAGDTAECNIRMWVR
jgi:hypothetical protein